MALRKEKLMTDFSETRALFHIPADMIYLDGNSLGPLTIAAEKRVASMMQDQWKAVLKSIPSA